MSQPMPCIICKHAHLPPDRPQVCEWCQTLMVKQLRMLERAVPWLSTIASGEPMPTGHPNLAALDLSLPGNPVITGEAGDQTGHIPVATKLAQWAEDWSGRDILLADAASVAAFLRRGLRWACASHPAVDEFARELRQTYAAVKVALNRNMRGRRYSAPCPHCGQRTLMRYPGADWIECGPCEALYDEEDYATVVIAQIPPWALITAQQAAQVAGVSYDVVRKWVQRGKLQAIPGPWGGRRLYERGDVDAVWNRPRRKRYDMVTV